MEIKYDSTKTQLINRIRQFGDIEQTRHRLAYNEDSVSTKQDEIIELIKKLTLEAQSYVDKGIDTTGLTNELKRIEYWYDISTDGVFINKGPMQTHRNLETTYKIMRELLIRVTARKSALDAYYKQLVGYRNTLDSFYKEEALYKFSSDSAVLMRYVEKLSVVLQEIRPIDSALKKTLLSISELQPPINMLAIKLNASIEQIQAFQKELSIKTFNRESNNLWGSVKFARPFKEILQFSLIKAKLSFVFYVQNEWEKIILLLVLIAVCTAFLTNMKQRIQQREEPVKTNLEQSILRYPLLSSLFIVLTVFQFIFLDPPFLFSALTWFLSGLSLTFIIYKLVARYWMIAWLIIFTLFLFACADNLILQSSRPERWVMLTLSIAGIFACTTIVLKGLRTELKEKILFYFIGFLVILEFASIIANLYGRVNLTKTFLIAGFFNVVLVILFFWTLYFIGHALALSAMVYNRPNRKLINVNFEWARGRTPKALYFLLFVGWFVLFGRNFYAFRFVSEPVINFFNEKRTIGDFSFTIGNVFSFFLILYTSGLISRVVSFFASNVANEPASSGRKGGFSSWVLIIRISIITIGLLAASAAMGIPMDRLTLILSALSVGVGFGLQKLINNLVSGLIITVEKPLSVGDIIEIDGQSGIVKSIGFRSSIIAMPNGADVVIPNGDLLDQRLVNWTHENTLRSVDIKVYVAQGAELEKVIKLLKDLSEKDARILKVPAPQVLINQLKGNVIEMQLTCWIQNLMESSQIKSDMMLAIDIAFRNNSIVTSVPILEMPTIPV